MKSNLAENTAIPIGEISLLEKLNIPFTGKPEWFYAGDEVYLRMIRRAYQKAHDEVVGTIARRMKLELDGKDVSRFATQRLKAIQADIKGTIVDLDRELGKIMTKGYKNAEQQIATMAYASSPGVGAAFDKFISASTKPYLYKGAFLRKFADSTSRGYNAELLKKVESVLRMGVIQRKSWGEVVTDLRQKAWGLQPYQRDTAVTYRAKRLARTELARRRQLAVNEFIKNPDVIGVHIMYGGGPCPSGQCPPLVGYYYKDGSEKGWPPPEVPFHPNCYAEGTEVYTDRGWVLFENLKGNEQFISRTPEGNLEWTKAVKYFEYPYQGKMYELTTNSFHLMITPNHNQPYETRVQKNRQRQHEYQLTSLTEMLKRPEYRIPRTATWTGEIDYSEDMARFMGYYLSEGSTTKRSDKWYQIQIAQKDETVRQKIAGIAKEITTANVSIGKEAITISGDIDLGEFLIKFGKSHGKHVPYGIKNASPEIIEAFLEAYLEGDGHERTISRPLLQLESNEKVFFTSSQRMATDLGELILKVGGYPSYSVMHKAGKRFNCWRSGKEHKLNHDVIKISWNRSKYATHQHIKVSEHEYDGLVRDVELEKNHVLWIRYNGKTSFSGNCRCSPVKIIGKPEIPEKKK